jgi:hypothetical protein
MRLHHPQDLVSLVIMRRKEKKRSAILGINGTRIEERHFDHHVQQPIVGWR